MPPLDAKRANLSADSVAMAIAIAVFYQEEYLPVIDEVSEGRFTFFGQSVTFAGPGAVDWHHTVPTETDFHLWRMKLAHMGFLCPMLTSDQERHHAAVRELIRGYRNNTDFGTPGCFSSYWFPYSVSHRILAALSGYVLGFEQLEANLKAELDDFIRWNAAFVAANVEHELRNNHVERNLAALCFYYTCATVVPEDVSTRLDREVRRVMTACVLGDGLIAERSAMYQGLTVMSLDIFARTPFLADTTRQLARDNHTKALKAWSTMTHPDGDIALFNDSWLDEVPTLANVTNGEDIDPLIRLPEAGYSRMESEGIFVLMDAGPIGPRWNPGHGHADFLSIEADVAGLRFIVDPGTYQYSTGDRRSFERSNASHNGPHELGVEPVEYTGCFRVGRMISARLEETDSPTTSTGRLKLRGGRQVSRTVSVTQGRAIVSDLWSGCTAPQVRLTIPDDWILGIRGDNFAEFNRSEASAVIHVLKGAVQEVGAGAWSRRYLVTERASTVLLVPQMEASGYAYLEWEIRTQEAQ